MAPSVALPFYYSFLEIFYCVITVSLLCGYFWYLKKHPHLTQKQHLQKGILFGFAFNLFSLSWLYTIYPLLWLPKGFIQFIAIGFIHVLSSFIASLGFAIVGLTFFYTKKYPLRNILLIPFSFSVAEIIRSLLLSLLYLGTQSTLGIHWTAGTIGNALSWTPLIELAYLGGTFSLTWAVVSLVYPFFVQKQMKHRYFFLLLPFIPTFFIHYVVPLHGPTQQIKILVTNTNFDGYPVQKGEGEGNEWIYRKNTLVSLLASFASSSPEIIVLPEDAHLLSLSTEKEQTGFHTHFPNTLLIDGDTLPFGDAARNYTLFYDEASASQVGRGKTFLFPFNEYLPYLFQKSMAFVMGDTYVTQYEKEHTYSRDSKLFTYPSPFGNIGSLVCSEVLSYQTIEKLKSTNPDIVVLQSYLSVFHQSPLFYMHYFSFTKIAAAELRAPLIVSSQQAPSMLISATGNIQMIFEANQKEAKGEVVTVDKK